MSCDIRTWWVNRFAGYCIPSIFFFLFFRDVWRGEISKAVDDFLWGALIAAAFELLFFGFRVTIEDHQLTYRRGYGVFSRPVTIRKQDLVNVEYTYFDPQKKIRTASVIVHSRDLAAPRLVMHLAGFSPANVRKIIAWLQKE